MVSIYFASFALLFLASVRYNVDFQFGFIHDTIRVMVLRKYDEETWNKIL